MKDVSSYLVTELKTLLLLLLLYFYSLHNQLNKRLHAINSENGKITSDSRQEVNLSPNKTKIYGNDLNNEDYITDFCRTYTKL